MDSYEDTSDNDAQTTPQKKSETLRPFWDGVEPDWV